MRLCMHDLEFTRGGINEGASYQWGAKLTFPFGQVITSHAYERVTLPKL